MWYYAQHGQQIGPVSKEELQGLLRSQTLAVTVNVWTEGMPAWQQANLVPELISGVHGGLLPEPVPGGAYVPPVVNPTVVAMPTNAMAITSMVLGLLGIFLLGPLGSIPAIICGHMARRQIQDSNGQQQGDGMALAGLITGYIITALYAALVLLVIIVIRMAS